MTTVRSASRARRRPGRWWRGLAVSIVFAALGTLAVWMGFRSYTPDETCYPLLGVDVSHHQGRIDWPAVAADGVDFAYLKATEGGDHRDREFTRNWEAARAAGLAVGAYHFFTFCRAGAEQADNVLATVPVAVDALPLAVDLEFGGNCDRVPTVETLGRELRAFLGPVEAAYGKPVVLYVTPEFLDAYRTALPTRGLWRRSLLRVPDDAAPWRLWQYHNRARIDGIVGPVDLDTFDGDRVAFDAWRAAKTGSATTRAR